MGNIIELKDVNYKYPNAIEKTLRNLNVDIEKGKFTVIMGPTGAGKTTLTLCCNGIIPQILEGEISGKINVSGMDTSKYRVQTLAKHVGVVLQDPETQIFGMTVEEDTAFGPRNYLVPKEEIGQRVEDALKRVRLNGYEKRNTTELSGGEKQRLAIAGVLSMQPEVLILDEPTSELDPMGREEIYETLEYLRKEKDLTIIVVEHSSEDIAEKAENIVVLNNGEKVWEGKSRELFSNIELTEKFGVKPLSVSKVGWELYKKGYISKENIPLNVDEAESIIKDLLKGKTLRKIEKIEVEKKNTAPILLSVKGVEHKYKNGKLALNKVNLDIHEGEFVAFIGQNGAGKTTLAKHFNGLLQPTSGNVNVCGMDTKKTEIAKLSQFIGYVFQNPDHQIFSTTVEEELRYGLKNSDVPENEIDGRIDKALEFTKLTKYKKVHPFSLSKGQRQMIAVASILVLEPKILVIDEPTTGLDWIGINNMMNLIDILHKSGTTIIMITHDMDIATKYAQRVIVMKNGNIMLDGRTEEVMGNFEILHKAYVNPPQIVRLSKKLGLKYIVKNEDDMCELILRNLEE